MDPIKTGKIISDLRKSKGWTQLELAEKLFVSDRTISKWESGVGFPEITQLPELAKIFNVSTDYLFALKDEINKKLIDRLEECAINDDVVLFNQLKEQGLLNEKDENGKTLTDYVKLHRSGQLFGLLLEENKLNNKSEPVQNEFKNVQKVNDFGYSNANQNNNYSSSGNAVKLIKPITFILLAAALLGLITYFTKMVSLDINVPFIGLVTSSFSLLDLLGSNDGLEVFMSALFLIAFFTQIINSVIVLATSNVKYKKYAVAFKIISATTFGILVVASAMFANKVNHYYPISLLLVNIAMFSLALINLFAKYNSADEIDNKKPKYYIKHSKVLEILSIVFTTIFAFVSIVFTIIIFPISIDTLKLATTISVLIMLATMAYNAISLVRKKAFAWGMVVKGLNIFAVIFMFATMVNDSSTNYSLHIVAQWFLFGVLLVVVFANLISLLKIGKRES